MQLKGIGAITASALVSAIADGKEFSNGRQLAAWLGLTPSQYSSGGKQKLGRITKAGDSYIRSLLVQGPDQLWPVQVEKTIRLVNGFVMLKIAVGINEQQSL